MKALKAIAIIVLTLFIYFIWINFPGFIPRPPEYVSVFVVELFNAETQEQVADIEILYVLILSFIVAITTVLTAFILKRCLKGSNNKI